MSGSISQGMTIDDSDPARLAEALRLAFDYRGDVTLHLRDGRTLEGYIYDRRTKPSPAVRMLLRDRDERVLIEDRLIASLVVSGKDTAAGKSFENWIRRYAEQKLRGESAGIDSEPLA